MFNLLLTPAPLCVPGPAQPLSLHGRKVGLATCFLPQNLSRKEESHQTLLTENFVISELLLAASGVTKTRKKKYEDKTDFGGKRSSFWCCQELS